MLRRSMIFTLLAIGSMVVLASSPVAAAPKPGDPEPPKGSIEPPIVAYKGKMVDESGKPVSGIFPITFKLYPGENSKKATWSETLWVAVDRGTYTVRLGERKPLPAGDKSRAFIGVDIRGVGEVVREPFSAAGHAAGGGSGPAKQGGGTKYADTAGYAVESDHAKNADRLQNMTIEDLARRLAEEGLGAPRNGGGGARIGSSRRFGARIGGPGGTAEYNETCPKGHVMVGIKGGAGMYLDSIQIICAPLE